MGGQGDIQGTRVSLGAKTTINIFVATHQCNLRIRSQCKKAVADRCRPKGKIVIDYRSADGRFLMSPRGVAVSNTRYLSSSERRVYAGIRG